MLAFGLLYAQPDGWQVNSSEYEYSMTLSAVVKYEGTSYGEENDYLAAFIDGSCRGVVEASYVEAYDRYMFFLTVFSNTYQGEEITFKYYNAKENNITSDFLNETFTHGANLGEASNPYWVSDEVQLEEYDVTFIVNDGENPIEGATIVIDTGTISTNSEGTVTTQLTTGKYAYSVSAEGYTTFDDSIEVAEEAVSKTVSLSLSTGTFDKPKTMLKVYPNPARDYVIINSNQMKGVDIISLQGKIVHQNKNCGDEIRLNISNLNPGMYILRIHSSDKYVRKTELLIQ